MNDIITAADAPDASQFMPNGGRLDVRSSLTGNGTATNYRILCEEKTYEAGPSDLAPIPEGATVTWASAAKFGTPFDDESPF